MHPLPKSGSKAGPTPGPAAERPTAPSPPPSPPRADKRTQLRTADEGSLDPLSRSLALPPTHPPARPPEPVASSAPAALAPLDVIVLDRLVRSLAWGGNGRKGSARIELGAGALAGATLVIHADGREVSLELEVPTGADPGPWTERLRARLEQRGLVLGRVDVR